MRIDLNAAVGDVARNDPVRLLENETIAEALSRLRGEVVGERIVYFYITDTEGKLVGVVPTRRLILSGPSALAKEVMIHPVYSVNRKQRLGRALESLLQRRLLALPVVDDEGRLTGILDMPAFSESLELERREVAEEAFQLVGIHIEEARNKGVWRVLGNRFPWLIMNIGSGLAAAFIANFFDDVLKAVVAIAFFIPLVLTLAESIAMQTVTMSLQRHQVDRTGVAVREIWSGLALGLISGFVVGLLGFAWLQLFPLACVVAASIVIAGSIGPHWGTSFRGWCGAGSWIRRLRPVRRCWR